MSGVQRARCTRTREEIEVINRVPVGLEFPEVPKRVRLWPSRARCYRCRGFKKPPG